MKLKVTLVNLLAVAAPFAEAIGFVADKGTGRDNGDAEDGVQFVSFLRRRPDSMVTAEIKTGGASLMDNGAGIQSSRYMQVSRAQLTALRQYRSWTQRKREEATDLPITLIRDLGSEYVGSIGIGTKRCQTSDSDATLKEVDCSRAGAQSNLTSVVFDTGSTNIWMASVLCKAGPCTNPDRQRYNPSLSSTFNEMEDSTELEVTFGTAMLRGPLGIDDFHIGPFTVKDQAFALIEEEIGSTFRDLPLEGIVGLAFPSMSANKRIPFFDSVIKQKVLKKNMFCFYLSSGAHRDSLLSGASDLSDARGTQVGAILWGGYDEKMFEGPLLWFPVTKAHYWAIDLLEFRIGNESLPVTTAKSLVQTKGKDQKSYLIVDTGTTYYTAQGALYRTIASRLGTADCSKVEQYPPITYVLKDIHGSRQELTIAPEEYMTSDGPTCELAFMNIGPPAKYGPAMLLGELFMRKYFTVFDRGDGSDGDARIGIARSRNVALSSLLEQSETTSRHPKRSIVRKSPVPSNSVATVLIGDSGEVEIDHDSSK